MRSRVFITALLLLTALPTAFAAVQLIQNGGFEATSPAPWGFNGSGVAVGNTLGFAASGSQYLTMGNYLVGAGQAYQIVTFPTNMIAATLSFDYATVTTNASGADSLIVYIGNTDNPVPEELIGGTTLSSANPVNSYQVLAINIIPYAGGGALSTFAGQTVEVFFDDTCNDTATSFFIDNVSLLAATPADIPPNDNFANPIPIPTSGITNYGTTTYASLETGEPEINGNEGGHSVWWTWTAPSVIGVVNINAGGSSYNTLLGVYTGTSLTNLTLITNGVFTSTHQAEIQFVPVPGTQYQIALDGYNGQSGNAEFTFRYTADKTPPVVSFVSPASGATVTNSSVSITGKASDNVAVATVQYLLQNANGVSAWQTATTTNLWTNWSATVTNLIPGTNTVTLRAFDTSSNLSALVSHLFNYDLVVPLTLNTNGRGTISGATNGQFLDLGFPYKLTAKAAAGFAFTEWTGSIVTNNATVSFTMSSNLNLTANFVDDQKPVLSITTPTSGSHWSNAVLQIAGKASDNVAVAGVWYQLNGGAWMNPATSNAWTTWATNVTLTQSNNTLKGYAVDGAGNYSTTNSVTFAYVPSAILQLATTGSGAISPNYSNALLQIGKTFTLTATARSGYLFSNWVDNTGTVVTNGPALKFIMQSNLLYTANFVPNPFLTTAGTYEGLFFNTYDVVPSGSGFFSAVVANAGTFTAKFQIGTSVHSIAGKFGLDGTWSTNAVAGLTGTSASLTLDLTGGNTITGGLTNAAWNSVLTANLAPYSAAHPAPQAGKYTLVIPFLGIPPNLPQGSGFGSVTVTAGGAVTWAATLGDGTKATPTATVSAQGNWPLYIPITANGQGALIGWLTFTNKPDRDIDGEISWFEPELSSSRPAFSIEFEEVVGSTYTLPAAAPILKLTDGYVLLQQGLFQFQIVSSNQFVLGANNKVTGSDKLILTFTPATGLFSGSTTNASGKTLTFTGAVLQKQTNGFGQFLNGQQTGSVYLAPQ